MTENEVIELLKNNYPKTRKMVDGRRIRRCSLISGG